MQGTMVPVVLLPRFTTYVGEAAYDTAALDVTEFDRLVVEFGCGALVGGGSFTFDVEESHDGLQWFGLASVSAAGAIRVDLTRRWLRVVTTLGDDQALTCWCSGQLRRRVG